MTFIQVALALISVGAWVYCVLAVLAARRHLTPSGPVSSASSPSVAVLKPLAGAEPSLEANLRSFFAQDYSRFELLFAARTDTDPALAVVSALQREYPEVPATIIVTGEPPYPNAKVFSLARMTAYADAEWIVMSDSDVRVPPDFLKRLAGEWIADSYDLATCPYLAVPGPTFWSLLEAIGMNTEFWASALVAKLVEGVRFTVGPTVVARRKVLDTIPWGSLSRYLAEDFVLGHRAAAFGFRVELSRVVVEHHLSDESMAQNFNHRLRWARSTRRSRPSGYIGQLFTNPLPLALLLVIIDLRWWPVLLVSVLLRLAVVHATAAVVLGDRQWLRRLGWVPLQDLLSFVFWVAGFVGNTITWRGRRYRLNRDGTFDLIR